MKNFRMYLLAVAALLIAACRPVAQENNHIVNLEAQPFSTIDIHSDFIVTLRQADTYSVQIRLPAEMKEYLEAGIKGKRLQVKFSNNTSGRISRNSKSKECRPEIKITAPSFEKIDISGVVELTLAGRFELNTAKIEASGASHIFGDEIQAETLELDASSASDIQLKLFADCLEAEASGASHIELEPLTDRIGTFLSLDVSGASHVDTKQLPYNSVEADISGASHADVFAVKELKAEATGASHFRYIDSSELRDKDLHSSGVSSIKCKQAKRIIKK